MLKYCSEKIPLVLQVNQMEIKRPLKIAQETLYHIEFCHKIDRI